VRRILCCVLLSATLPSGAEPPARRPSRPAWVDQSGIVMAGNWEPLSFIRRRGGQSVEDVENWMAERSERAARGLSEAGVNLVVTNLHKGAGLAAEAEDIDATRRFTALAHKYGIRVGGYVGNTMLFETFFLEEPGARDWMQVDENGRPIYYGDAGSQTFRYVACRNNPGYQAFIEKVVRLGIEDIKLDLIHFDQMHWWSEPKSCRCRYCKERFSRWLTDRYPSGSRLARFGFERIEGFVPPVFDLFEGPVRMPRLNNPVMQEWALWRASEVTRHYAAHDVFIHSLNPEVALEGNPGVNPSHNGGFTNGVDVGSMLEHGDIVWSEEGSHASWTSDGRLVSKIRSFKAARIMGKSLFIYTGGRYGAQDPASPPQLRIAEAMAFNGNNIGMVGDVHPEGIRLTPDAQRYIRFFRAHQQAFADTEPVGDAAVLRAFAAVEFNPAEANVAATLAEQTLIQHHIPFNIVFDRHLNDLSRYKVLVLADQDALSDAQLDAIRRFVESGGGLVATGASSLLTDWRLTRRKFGLADVFGIDTPAQAKGAVRREFGRGRVVYLPAIVPAVAPPKPRMNYALDFSAWKLPVNHLELAEAVRWAARGELTAAAAVPQSVAMELTRRKSTGDLNLHLVNFDFRHPVQGVVARLRLPEGRRLRQATLATPDGAGDTRLAVTMEPGGVARLSIPRLDVYTLIRLQLE
jgi:hypothetical protein